MSNEAGGALLIIPAAGVLACAATAVIAGGIALGVGYLAVKGACRGAKACKDSWNKHLEELEQERKMRLAQAMAEDEQRLSRIKNAFVEMARQSDDFLKEHNDQIRHKLEKEEEKRLAEEQRKAEELALQKRMELIEEELNGFRKNISSPLLEPSQKSDYLETLEKARQEMRSRNTNVHTGEIIEEADIDSFEVKHSPEELSSEQREEKNPFLERISFLRAEVSLNLSLTEKEKKKLDADISDISAKVNSFSGNSQEIEKELGKLEDRAEALAARERNYRETRRMAVDCYLALQERLITAEMDKPFAALIKEPLQELRTLMESAKDDLYSYDFDPAPILARLEEGKEKFENGCNNKLLEYQNELNQYARTAVEKVLQGREYQNVQSRIENDVIIIEGKGKEHSENACVTCAIMPEGELKFDLSHEGFANQTECDREFRGLQADLLKEGVYVDLKKQEKTWLKETVQFFYQKLEEMGYKPENINEETIASGVKLVATHSEDDTQVIEINPRNGVKQETVRGKKQDNKAKNSLKQEKEDIIHHETKIKTPGR
jgi:uncharacterized protein (UPF0297 family)